MSCGGPTSPSKPAYPLAAESPNFRYFYASGDSVNSDWQERYHAWATARLHLSLPQKISYYKFVSRQDMGDHTGVYNVNAYSSPGTFTIYTLWSTDNHEVVHVYTAQYGDAPALFNEGIAVSFQVDPVAGDFVSRFNGEAVDDACRAYLGNGSLVLPLERIIQTADWIRLPDNVLAYREAGSFMRFMTDHYGLDRVLRFFQISSVNDDAATIKVHLSQTIGVPLEQVEQEWLAFLRS